jgi:hypothetical protein
MVKHFVGGALALAMLALVSASTAAEGSGDAPALAAYKRTGVYERCLATRQIQSSRILNRRQILFEMTGGRAYLAEPDCPGLSPDLALAYDATSGQLCNTTIIRLLELGTSIPERGSCGIERFEKLEKR